MPSPSSITAGENGSGGNGVPLVSEDFPALTITARMDEILRCLGYPREATPPARMVTAIEQLVATALPHLQPSGTYSLYALAAQTPRSLTIGGATITGNIGEFLHGAERIAVFMVTAGSAITRLAETSCRDGDPFAGWVMDAIGSWAAEAAADALTAHLNRHLAAEESLTMRYSPGYCGMDLAMQRTLFKLARADTVGISLLPSLLMQPIKSVSGIVGLGPRGLVGVNLSPCDRCPQVGCHMRR
jgi:hypothetical protein